ncbi:MAG: SUMF1/EgtB/PvdO family nonheme iron enzyme [Candidatus Sumerlaeota bacterium]|nr:SUMF1/EgtB/PvdO family nonheme iron enzyme [Candidatus Sumerlaeota bacterium]
MFCPQCGKENRDDMRFCYGCGFDLKQSAPPSSRPSDSRQPSSHPSDSSDVGVGATGMPSDVSDVGKGATGMPSDISASDSMLNPAGAKGAELGGLGGGAADALAAGALVGNHYQITRKLGQGGMGVVYQARERLMGHEVALKFIAPKYLSSRSARERFLGEARASIALSHPNIIRMYPPEEWEGRIFLVMEYVEGRTLRAAMDEMKNKGKRLGWNGFVDLFTQALSAAAYAHEQHIAHRDLKPENLLIGRQPNGKTRVVVMDFGLAKMLDKAGLTLHGAGLGTPYYMAPEQRSEAATADVRADVFSLGVIAYEILTGSLPVGRYKAPSQIRPDLPKGIDDWILRAMEPAPEDRFDSAGEMLKELHTLLQFASVAESADSASVSAPPSSTSGASRQSSAPSRGASSAANVNAAQSYVEDMGQNQKAQMIWIAGGTFNMGSPLSAEEIVKRYGGDPQWHKNAPIHDVSLDAFWIAEAETTVDQFRVFVESTGYRTEAEKMGSAFGLNWKTGVYEDMPGLNWKNPGFAQTGAHPVVCVSWNDAKAFCDWLSKRTGRCYALPSEAQWEYACRAGTETEFYFGNGVEDGKGYLNGCDQSCEEELKRRSGGKTWTYKWPWDDGYACTSPVIAFKPNAWGLYDMHGNVFEWCADWYGAYPGGPVKNPTGPASGEYRVLRGGSWIDNPDRCRSAFRDYRTPDYRYNLDGFRLTRTKN